MQFVRIAGRRVAVRLVALQDHAVRIRRKRHRPRTRVRDGDDGGNVRLTIAWLSRDGFADQPSDRKYVWRHHNSGTRTNLAILHRN